MGDHGCKVQDLNDGGIVHLSESDWLAFRQSRPLFPSLLGPLTSKY